MGDYIARVSRLLPMSGRADLRLHRLRTLVCKPEDAIGSNDADEVDAAIRRAEDAVYSLSCALVADGGVGGVD